MLRLIIRTMPAVSRQLDGSANGTEPSFRVFEFDCAELEAHLKSPVPAMHRRIILGYETYEAPEPKEPEKKAVNPELAKRLEQMKNKNANQNNGNGNKSKFAKWEEKAKLAKAKEAKEKEGKANGKGWFGFGKAATS